MSSYEAEDLSLQQLQKIVLHHERNKANVQWVNNQLDNLRDEIEEKRKEDLAEFEKKLKEIEV
jgi:hypothetical protein